MTKLSILDLVHVRKGANIKDAIDNSVQIAQEAEKQGFTRVWYAEHHNMATIASSATAVLIGHVADHTTSIRLGSGGVMLPNHSPLIIAEQFGTLATIHGDRIDLGLGRAPGTDQVTLRALRRSPAAAESFPQDVLELQDYLSNNRDDSQVNAYPGHGTEVPLYILGSSRFGAQLAAQLGLPYAFASHFAPTHLETAARLYRESYQPSERHPEPYFIAALNSIAADTAEEAVVEANQTFELRVEALVGRNRKFTDTDRQLLMASPAAEQVRTMLQYTAVGTAEDVSEYIDRFAQRVQADEVITTLASPTPQGQLRTLKLLGAARS
ncbi:LLM class flavin-dependent oxidoreductase [Corynebacterium epidermidicanis]|uniref:Luciferase family oxidoreductase, group 1 n=1 Tax=Corynebacterium epidermidicanis TaxID=1050174 RepID=A0A0G3GNJ9_9CORY|nr:LLM class flavin-dependent oxidoreductase [Corynebacterium epidermidicanis]AKK02719.1 luciferase family oxidoreductase, group 1 [Corynebacterium epidermidicanis]